MAKWLEYRLSCSRSWVRAPVPSYQRPSLIWYKLLPCLARRHKGRSSAVKRDCYKGRVVCGTAYGHLKDILVSFARVRYCIPVPDFLFSAAWPSLDFDEQHKDRRSSVVLFGCDTGFPCSSTIKCRLDKFYKQVLLRYDL